MLPPTEPLLLPVRVLAAPLMFIRVLSYSSESSRLTGLGERRDARDIVCRTSDCESDVTLKLELYQHECDADSVSDAVIEGDWDNALAELQ